MLTKPDYCVKRCGYRRGSGFVPGESIAKLSSPLVRVMFLLEAPGSWEAIHGWPLAGRTGEMFFEEFVEPLGHSREEVLIDNVLRCQPPRRGKTQTYPVGKERLEAEKACRHWDVLTQTWKPNIVGLTYHPASLFRDRQRTVLVEQAVKKAFRFAEIGFRPALLMGEHARDVYMPWLAGALKAWQNHWDEVSPSFWGTPSPDAVQLVTEIQNGLVDGVEIPTTGR